MHPFDELQEAAFSPTLQEMKTKPCSLGSRLWRSSRRTLGLEWNDVDLKTGVIRIRQTRKDDGGHFATGPTQGKTERSLTISPTTLTALRTLRNLDVSQDLCFSNENGGYIKRQTFNRYDWARTMRRHAINRRHWFSFALPSKAEATGCGHLGPTSAGRPSFLRRRSDQYASASGLQPTPLLESRPPSGLALSLNSDSGLP